VGIPHNLDEGVGETTNSQNETSEKVFPYPRFPLFERRLKGI
jgi:hypothetical protein